MTMYQQLLADLVEFAPDAMLIVGASGQILYANQRVTDLFGYLQWATARPPRRVVEVAAFHDPASANSHCRRNVYFSAAVLACQM